MSITSLDVLNLINGLSKTIDQLDSNIGNYIFDNESSSEEIKWNGVRSDINRAIIALYIVYNGINDNELNLDDNADVPTISVIQSDSTSSGLPEIEQTESRDETDSGNTER